MTTMRPRKKAGAVESAAALEETTKKKTSQASADSDDSDDDPLHTFLHLIKDSSVIETLGSSLAPILSEQIDASINKNLAKLSDTLKSLYDKNKQLEKEVSILKVENSKLNDRINSCEKSLLLNERFNNRRSIMITGLPEGSWSERSTASVDPSLGPGSTDTHETVEDTVLKFFKDKLDVDLTKDQINSAYRMKSPKNSNAKKESNKRQIGPVTIEFTSVKTRNLIMKAKSQLKNNNDNKTFISEKLTKQDASLFYKARQLKKNSQLTACWTYNGQVYVRYSSDIKEVPTKIDSDETIADMVKALNDMQTFRNVPHSSSP